MLNKKLKELQFRVGDLMIVIVDHVTLGLRKYQGGVQMGSLTTSDDITAFLGQFNKISAQNGQEITLYKQPNSTIEKCMNRLSTAMQKFTVRWKSATGRQHSS